MIAVGNMPTTHAGHADAYVPSLVDVTYESLGELLARTVSR